MSEPIFFFTIDQFHEVHTKIREENLLLLHIKPTKAIIGKAFWANLGQPPEYCMSRVKCEVGQFVEEKLQFISEKGNFIV